MKNKINWNKSSALILIVGYLGGQSANAGCGQDVSNHTKPPECPSCSHTDYFTDAAHTSVANVVCLDVGDQTHGCHDDPSGSYYPSVYSVTSVAPCNNGQCGNHHDVSDGPVPHQRVKTPYTCGA